MVRRRRGLAGFGVALGGQFCPFACFPRCQSVAGAPSRIRPADGGIASRPRVVFPSAGDAFPRRRAGWADSPGVRLVAADGSDDGFAFPVAAFALRALLARPMGRAFAPRLRVVSQCRPVGRGVGFPVAGCFPSYRGGASVYRMMGGRAAVGGRRGCGCGVGRVGCGLFRWRAAGFPVEAFALRFGTRSRGRQQVGYGRPVGQAAHLPVAGRFPVLDGDAPIHRALCGSTPMGGRRDSVLRCAVNFVLSLVSCVANLLRESLPYPPGGRRLFPADGSDGGIAFPAAALALCVLLARPVGGALPPVAGRFPVLDGDGCLGADGVWRIPGVRRGFMGRRWAGSSRRGCGSAGPVRESRRPGIPRSSVWRPAPALPQPVLLPRPRRRREPGPPP